MKLKDRCFPYSGQIGRKLELGATQKNIIESKGYHTSNAQ